MTSRLYPTTQFLYIQITSLLRGLGVETISSPTQFELMALYLSGLILLDKRQNNQRISRWLPGRCHDALNRLLRTMPLSTRRLMGLLISSAQRLGVKGYLSLDDVVVPKPFSRVVRWVDWVYCASEKRSLRGMNIVVILWCWQGLKLPVAFRLWQSKRQVGKADYRTKHQLAQAMIIELRAAGLPFEYLAFDSWYNARWFTKWLTNCNIFWVTTAKRNTKVVYRHQSRRLDQLEPSLKWRWRKALQLRTSMLNIFLPSYGSLRLVVTKNARGKSEFILTNAWHLDVVAIITWKRSRWDIETLFRNSKQLAGLAACECRVPQAVVRHVALVLLTCALLDLLGIDWADTPDGVKEKLQLLVVTQGQQPPTPLLARSL